MDILNILGGGFKWEPKKDITTYELALAIPALLVIASPFVKIELEKAPAEVLRHFRELEKS